MGARGDERCGLRLTSPLSESRRWSWFRTVQLLRRNPREVAPRTLCVPLRGERACATRAERARHGGRGRPDSRADARAGDAAAAGADRQAVGLGRRCGVEDLVVDLRIGPGVCVWEGAREYAAAWEPKL